MRASCSTAAVVTIGVLMLLDAFAMSGALSTDQEGLSTPDAEEMHLAPHPMPHAVSARKFLSKGGHTAEGSAPSVTPRANSRCSANEIAIRHYYDEQQFNAISIKNKSNRTVGNIHVHCGHFGYENYISPSILRFLSYDDCLVNDGLPLRAGEEVAFTCIVYRPPLFSISSPFCPNRA